ncbi:hypothetical protein H6P81_001963 [Aristolochia fimbriata]|uniref:BSD domain-containing protein n=1 Tax=Aristolochia fimbriata TaxID=158543 RepID=A0AAV7F8C7_ARIFI|nr:hypothetical protein H6P81_001963 [Aristolochia fimbriata]
MNFFKSVFADPDPSDPQDSPSHSPKKQSQSVEQGEDLERDEGKSPIDESPSPKSDPTDGSVWSFGGLIKTITAKSETVIQTYRRDLEEFSSELKKETAILREAIKDLPGSLEVGASVAQESLETVGQAIDEFGSSVWRGTADIITHGKDALLVDQDSDSSDVQTYGSSSRTPVRYSRFEAQVRALQSESNTYSEAPEDLGDFEKWKSGFSLDEKVDEIDNLFSENGALRGIYDKLVPGVINHDTFWLRYFYKVCKLKQVEDARADLVKRAISGDDEEELSWEVDEEEEEEVINGSTNQLSVIAERREKVKDEDHEISAEKKPVEVPEKNSGDEVADKVNIAEPVIVEVTEEKLPLESKTDSSGPNSDDSTAKADEKSLEGKAEPGDSSKDSDFSVVSSQRSSHEEEDLGWDEIEDPGSNDEKKMTSVGSPNKIDIRKRLSSAEEDEDLSWDIEDDEPVKQ